MRFRAILLGLASVLAGMAGMAGAQAADLVVVKPKRGPVAVIIQGKIDTGDSLRFAEMLLALDEARQPIGMLALDSPGGYLGESIAIAETVRRRRIPALVAGTCASGCFMIFAASPNRLAARSARIGVHTAYTRSGASDKGTAVMASYAERYGVPRTVIGKMIATAAPDIAWLDRRDIQAMHVRQR